MPIEGVALEAHSYSGGLRHTLLSGETGRPSWIPPAESVGWRDDFEIDARDVVIEFHQRGSKTVPVSWIAIYRRSTDAQFGDRSNHAGVGVWLRDKRIADAGSLLRGLDQLTTVLAQNPDPQAIKEAAGKFASDRFLGSYLLPAEGFPRDWSGAPASCAALVDTDYLAATATEFSAGVDRAADVVARLSLGWKGEAKPRTLILITPRASLPKEKQFLELPLAGGFLADLLEQVPHAFVSERETLRNNEADLATRVSQWAQQQKAEQDKLEKEVRQHRERMEAEQRAQQEKFEAERRELQMLDGLPPTMEGIAARLNGLSGQLSDVKNSIRLNREPPRVAEKHIPTPAPAKQMSSLQPDYQRSKSSKSKSAFNILLYTMLGVLLVISIGGLIFLMARVGL